LKGWNAQEGIRKGVGDSQLVFFERHYIVKLREAESLLVGCLGYERKLPINFILSILLEEYSGFWYG
jgi:hypothetical protein